MTCGMPSQCASQLRWAAPAITWLATSGETTAARARSTSSLVGRAPRLRPWPATPSTRSASTGIRASAATLASGRRSTARLARASAAVRRAITWSAVRSGELSS
eukprot:scaffold18839_cov35-Phaeocystis_antarctica.AAC.1